MFLTGLQEYIFYNVEWAEVRKKWVRFFERNCIVKWVTFFASFCWLWDFLQENHSFSSPNFGGFWTFLRHSSQCNFKFFRRWPIMAADIFTQPQPPQLPTALQVLWGCSSWASKNYAAQRVFRNCIVKWLIFLSNFCWLWDFYQRIWDL